MPQNPPPPSGPPNYLIPPPGPPPGPPNYPSPPGPPNYPIPPSVRQNYPPPSPPNYPPPPGSPNYPPPPGSPNYPLPPPGAAWPPTGAPARPPVPIAARPRRRGCSCGGCLATLLILVVVLVGSGAALYFLVQNGTISQHQIMNAIGLGTGEIQITNLSASTLTVTVTTLSTTPTPGESSTGGGLSSAHTMKPMETHQFVSIAPGRYDLRIGDGATSGPCTLKIESGDVYRIAILRTGTVITRDKEPGQTKADVLFPASGLCQR